MKNKFLFNTGRILLMIPLTVSIIIGVCTSDYLPESVFHGYDLNYDGTVNDTDVALVLTCAGNIADAPSGILYSSDTNGDGRINSADARIVSRNISKASVIIEEPEPVFNLVENNFESAQVDSSGNTIEISDKNQYNVISNQKMYIYPDMSQVMAIRNNFVIVAFGWGHGVGLSQWGAVGLARAGYSYIQIIQHYYQGVSIVKETPPPTVRCAGKDVDTQQMLARIIQQEISGITNYNDYYDMNALRAQAVAAYTNMKYSSYSVSGCSYVSNYSSCRDDVKAVAKEMVGQYMLYNNSVPYAYYSACSAGVAATYDRIWGYSDDDMSYLTNSASYYDCYTDGYISAEVYSPAEMREYILSYDPSINLSLNPADWIRILDHDDAVNEQIGYVSAMQIGDRTISKSAGLIFRDNIMKYNVKSPCFAIIYNGQYL